jgi:hypothetical protein
LEGNENMDRDEILIVIRLKLKIQLGDIAYYIRDTEDIRKKVYFKEENEVDFQESLNEEFNLNLNLNTIFPLTIKKIADEIENKKKGESSQNLDMSLLKLVMG